MDREHHLEACPWCDGDCELVEEVDGRIELFYVRCKDSNCQGYGDWVHGSKASAAMMWNERGGGDG